MKQSGFTLIELMITVAVIAILAAVAYPSYVEQVRKTRRANAQADLMELASFLERYYTNSATYKDATLPFTESPQDGGTKYYTISPTSISSATSYTLTATPKNGQAEDRCGIMTLNQAGVKAATKSGVAVNDCWQ